jgi:hypothetical protein
MNSKKVISLIVLFCAFVGLYKIIGILPSRVHQLDFSHYYISSRALIEHQDVYSVDFRDAFERYRFAYNDGIPRPTNPPLLIWLFALFAWMAPIHAFWSWALFQAVSCVVIMWMMKRALAEYSSTLVWPLSCAALLLSTGLYLNFMLSQVQLPLLAMILGAYLFHKERRVLTALTIVIIAGMIKLYPLVFVPWFIWRSTTIARKRIIYALYALVLACGIIYASGLNLWIDFLKTGMPIIRNAAINGPGNYSLPALFVQLGYSLYGFVPPRGVERHLMTAGGFVGMGIILSAYVSFFWTKGRRDLEFALLCIVSVLGGITAWPHYLIFLLFPFSLAFCEIRFDTAWKRILMVYVLGISVTAGAEIDLLTSRPSFYTYEWPLHYLPTFAMVILGCFLLSEIRKPSRYIQQHGMVGITIDKPKISTQPQ